LTLLLSGGCATVEQRIEDNRAVFETFPPDVQESIREGEIALGFTQEQVRIAMGNPDRIVTRTEEGEKTATIWLYVGRESRLARVDAFGPNRFYYGSHRGLLHRYPLLRPYYVQIEEEVVTDAVTFVDGEVAAYEMME